MEYALFQKAITLGVLQRYPEKISSLKAIVARSPKSSFNSEVCFEMGNTYLITNNPEEALINFRKVAADYPNSAYAPKSRLKTGLIYYNSGQSDLAMSTFKKVVTDFPATPESKEALVSIRNIYIDMGKVDEYFGYVEGLAFANISETEKDSVAFIAAENLYLSSGCEKARPLLEKYIHGFPHGFYLVSASYYLAGCLSHPDENEEALKLLDFVISSPKSEFTENALLIAARITYSNENFEASYGYFSLLTSGAENRDNQKVADEGLMKCAYRLMKYEEAIRFASAFLSFEDIDGQKKAEACLIKANSYDQLGEFLLAKSSFRDVVELSRGEPGAEAKYKLARIEYDLSDFDQAEKDVFELTNTYSAYDYWVASGFILLADIYVKKENMFQAKQTLQSIIDHYEGDELREMAIDRLNAILEEENRSKPEADSLAGDHDSIFNADEIIDQTSN
jgi:TolA-binding protein